MISWHGAYSFAFSMQCLFRLATGWSQKLAVIVLIPLFVLARILPCLFKADIVIHLDNNSYVLGTNSFEWYPFKEIYCDGVYERARDFVPERDWIVFDLGANIGLFTIQQARRGAFVYSFEPNPDCYRRLKAAVTINGLDGQVYSANYALGSGVDSGYMTMSKGTSVAGTVVLDGGSSEVGGPRVQVTSLDHIVPTFDVVRIDLLKIDVEGFEADVLRGARHTLSLVNRVIVECHSPALETEVQALLLPHGFICKERIDLTSTGDVSLLYAARSPAR